MPGRGIEPVVLGPGDDVVALAEAAVASGAPMCWAWPVATVLWPWSRASPRGTGCRWWSCPAGTRNHLAMDLGLDRGDVVGALDAFGAARELRVDLGDVNGRPFINNVSLGLYAQVVRSPEYREAKVETTVSMLPQLLGPGSRPFDLRFAGPAGEPHARAHVVQVSNNAYGRTVRTLISRPRLDAGRLGVIAVELPPGGPDRAFASALAAGQPERYPGFLAWEPWTSRWMPMVSSTSGSTARRCGCRRRCGSPSVRAHCVSAFRNTPPACRPRPGNCSGRRECAGGWVCGPPGWRLSENSGDAGVCRGTACPGVGGSPLRPGARGSPTRSAAPSGGRKPGRRPAACARCASAAGTAASSEDARPILVMSSRTRSYRPNVCHQATAFLSARTVRSARMPCTTSVRRGPST